MSPVIHLLIAWFIANLFSINLKERKLVLIAGVIAEVDAIVILFNENLFYQYHHTFGHTIVFGVIITVILMLVSKSKHKIKIFFVCFVAFGAHLLADLFGSDWGMPLFAPIISKEYSVYPYLSRYIIYNIINPLTAIFVLILFFLIYILKNRTPIEFFSKRYDTIICNFFRFPFTKKCDKCNRKAFFQCESCKSFICFRHVNNEIRDIRCRQCNDIKGKKN